MFKSLQEFLDAKLAEGLNEKEIATAILEQKEFSDLTTQEIASGIKEYMKLCSIQKALDEEKSKADKKSEIDQSVEAKLKSIGIDFTKKYNVPNEVKKFNYSTGKMEIVGKNESEARKAAQNLIIAIGTKDVSSQNSIAVEIESENQKSDSILGMKATPSVSDVAARGGYAIPTEVEQQIAQMSYLKSVMTPLVNIVKVDYLSKVFPVSYGIEVGYIDNQSTAIPEKNPTFANPTVNMHRIGGYSTIANEFLMEKGFDLVSLLQEQYSSAIAEFLDLHIIAGNVTGASDLVDGVLFDAYIKMTGAAVAVGDFSLAKVREMKNLISPKASLAKLAFIGNKAVSDLVGEVENPAGQKLFPGYIDGRGCSPYGIPLVTNPMIPSTLDIVGDNRTGGTDDALILMDGSKVYVGLSTVRLATSSEAFFKEDLFAMKVVQKFGQKVISGENTAGVVAVAQRITN